MAGTNRDNVHRCHAVACPTSVPPERLMCRKHWYMVPLNVRDEVLAHYRRGQCKDKRPTVDWLISAQLAIIAVAHKEGRPTATLRVRLDTLINRSNGSWMDYLERTLREVERAHRDGVIPDRGTGGSHYSKDAIEAAQQLGIKPGPPGE